MDKPAAADHPIHELLANRWSPRAFSDRIVPDALLSELFEAARWSPSCFNDQPWGFIVATRRNPEDFDKMLDCLVESNKTWAQAAPVLAISVCRRRFSHNGKPNRSAPYDVGQSVAHLSFQATYRGLRVHQMAGFSPTKAREAYSIPDEHEPMTAIAIGYPGVADDLPEKLRRQELAPRERAPISDFVFSVRYGATYPGIQKKRD